MMAAAVVATDSVADDDDGVFLRRIDERSPPLPPPPPPPLLPLPGLPPSVGVRFSTSISCLINLISLFVCFVLILMLQY